MNACLYFTIVGWEWRWMWLENKGEKGKRIKGRYGWYDTDRWRSRWRQKREDSRTERELNAWPFGLQPNALPLSYRSIFDYENLLDFWPCIPNLLLSYQISGLCPPPKGLIGHSIIHTQCFLNLLFISYVVIITAAMQDYVLVGSCVMR